MRKVYFNLGCSTEVLATGNEQEVLSFLRKEGAALLEPLFEEATPEEGVVLERWLSRLETAASLAEVDFAIVDYGSWGLSLSDSSKARGFTLAYDSEGVDFARPHNGNNGNYEYIAVELNNHKLAYLPACDWTTISRGFVSDRRDGGNRIFKYVSPVKFLELQRDDAGEYLTRVGYCLPHTKEVLYK